MLNPASSRALYLRSVRAVLFSSLVVSCRVVFPPRRAPLVDSVAIGLPSSSSPSPPPSSSIRPHPPRRAAGGALLSFFSVSCVWCSGSNPAHRSAINASAESGVAADRAD
eukprot:31241-Pelagococcus_subviridis.AAC.4